MISGMLRAVLRPVIRRWALGRLPSDLTAGDLCAIPGGEGGGFAILKVLAVDPSGVHVRLYKQRFTAIPADLDLAELSLGVFQAVGGGSDPFSIGHLPISREGLGLSGPIRIANRPVLADELDGYQMWLESHGGYFEGRIL